MIAGKLTFNLSRNQDSKDNELRDLIEDYLGGLIKYGNIWGKFVLSSVKKKFCAYAYLSHPNAMSKKYQTKYSRIDLKKIIEIIGNEPNLTLMDDAIDRTIPKWKSETFLYLFTHAFDFTSPVTLGSNGKSLPIYFLPLSDAERESAYFWASSYIEHDNI